MSGWRKKEGYKNTVQRESGQICKKYLSMVRRTGEALYGKRAEN